MSTHASKAAFRLAFAAAAACSSLPVSGPAVAAETSAQAGTHRAGRRHGPAARREPAGRPGRDHRAHRRPAAGAERPHARGHDRVRAEHQGERRARDHQHDQRLHPRRRPERPAVGLRAGRRHLPGRRVHRASARRAARRLRRRAHRSAARPAGHAVRQEHDRGRDQVRDARHRHRRSRRSTSPRPAAATTSATSRSAARRRSWRITFTSAPRSRTCSATVTASSSTTASRARSTASGQDVSDKDVLAARANATFVWGESSKLRVLADTIQDNSNAAGGQRLNNLVQPALNDRYDQRTDMPVDRDRFISQGRGRDLHAGPQRRARSQGRRCVSRRRRPPVHRLRRAEREPASRCRPSTATTRPAAKCSSPTRATSSRA